MSNILKSRQEIIISASNGIRNKKGKDVIYSCIESNRKKLTIRSFDKCTNVIQTNIWIPGMSFWMHFPAIFATIFRSTMVGITRRLTFSTELFQMHSFKSNVSTYSFQRTQCIKHSQSSNSRHYTIISAIAGIRNKKFLDLKVSLTFSVLKTIETK